MHGAGLLPTGELAGYTPPDPGSDGSSARTGETSTCIPVRRRGPADKRGGGR